MCSLLTLTLRAAELLANHATAKAISSVQLHTGPGPRWQSFSGSSLQSHINIWETSHYASGLYWLLLFIGKYVWTCPFFPPPKCPLMCNKCNLFVEVSRSWNWNAFSFGLMQMLGTWETLKDAGKKKKRQTDRKRMCGWGFHCVFSALSFLSCFFSPSYFL